MKQFPFSEDLDNEQSKDKQQKGSGDYVIKNYIRWHTLQEGVITRTNTSFRCIVLQS